MKLVFYIGVSLLLLIVSAGCGHSQTNLGGTSMPNIQGSITWKGKTYYASDTSVDKSQIEKSLFNQKKQQESKKYKVVYNVYKIKGVDPSKAIALKESIYYWKYTSENGE